MGKAITIYRKLTNLGYEALSINSYADTYMHPNKKIPMIKYWHDTNTLSVHVGNNIIKICNYNDDYSNFFTYISRIIKIYKLKGNIS